MNLKKDIREFLSLLDDEDVKKKIISIVSKKQKKSGNTAENIYSNEEYIKLKNERDKLKEDNNQLIKKHAKASEYKEKINDQQKKINELKKTNGKLKEENKDLKEQIALYNEKRLALECELKKYSDDFSELANVYSEYCSLSAEIKKSLSNIVSAASVQQFIISAGQWKNIEALWKNISYRLDDTPADEINRMTYIFEWLFNKYNEINDEYSILDVKSGDDFDGDFHSKGSKSAVTGKITEVLLKGYKNNTNGKIMEKSIVRI